jgi:DNA-binding NtrC family response regulator
MIWHGNVRELENVIERGILLCEGETLKPEHLMFDQMNIPSEGTSPMRAGVSMREMERMLISETLKEVNGNRTHAARMLGISIRTLRNKLREYRSTLSPYEEDKD